MFDYDLNIPLVTALGLNQPAQKTYVLKLILSVSPFTAILLLKK